jgi:hypothetical protein
MERAMTRSWAMGAMLALAGCGAPEQPAKQPAANVAAERAEPVAAPRPASTPTAPAAEPEPESEAKVNLAPDELTVVLESGAARHVTFGTSHDSTLQILGAALGNPMEQARNDECGAGPLDYAAFRGGLSLYFQDGKFAGWDLDGREKGGVFALANGIGIGSTRRQLEAAGDVRVRESTIGHEFALGDLSGLIDSSAATGKVTNLWAGTTCIAR